MASVASFRALLVQEVGADQLHFGGDVDRGPRRRLFVHGASDITAVSWVDADGGHAAQLGPDGLVVRRFDIRDAQSMRAAVVGDHLMLATAQGYGELRAVDLSTGVEEASWIVDGSYDEVALAAPSGDEPLVVWILSSAEGAIVELLRVGP